MSISICECGVAVDTDAHPDAYVNTSKGGQDWQAFCYWCKPEVDENNVIIKETTND